MFFVGVVRPFFVAGHLHCCDLSFHARLCPFMSCVNACAIF